MADENLQRAARIARQLGDDKVADMLDTAVGDHARGFCPGATEWGVCYRDRQAREYLAEHGQPAVSSSDAPNQTEAAADPMRLLEAQLASARKDVVQLKTEVDRLTAERDELQGHGVSRDIGEANERMRAELAALKANAVVLPEHWCEHLSGAIRQCRGVTHPLDSAVTAVHLMIESWLGHYCHEHGRIDTTAAHTPDTDTEEEVRLPDTEATEQAARHAAGNYLPYANGQPICGAHQRTDCELCSLNPSLCGDTPPGPGACLAYGLTGMHWTSCPNRVHRVALTTGHWQLGEQPLTPATPTPRVWRKGDPEPPESIQVLVDCRDDHLPYLCRIPGSRGWWQWFEKPADRRRAPGGVPWAEATAVMGSGAKDYVVALPEMTEVVGDQAGGEQP